MLELRPTCEHCNQQLPPESTEAMICSFECTFCRSCAVEVLANVCPNCGGGFSARPHRPSRNLKGNNYLGAYPASSSSEASSGGSTSACTVCSKHSRYSAGKTLTKRSHTNEDTCMKIF